MDMLKEFLFVVSDGQIVAVSSAGWFVLTVLLGGLVSVVFFTVDDPDWYKDGPGAVVLVAVVSFVIGVVTALILLALTVVWEWALIAVVFLAIMLGGGWVIGKAITHL